MRARWSQKSPIFQGLVTLSSVARLFATLSLHVVEGSEQECQVPDDLAHLASRLARPAAEAVCPEELPIFDDVAREFSDDPSSFRKNAIRKSALGSFGAGGAQLLANVLLLLAYDVLKDVAKDYIKEKVKSLLGSQKGKSPIICPAPSPEEMRLIVMGHASLLGLDGKVAEKASSTLSREVSVLWPEVLRLADARR